MKEWNRTGKIKAILLVVFSFPNLIAPIGVNPQQGLLVSILMPLIFGSIAIPLIYKSNSALLGREIAKPHWNDNPLALKRPFSFFHFGAFFFLAVGLSMVIGTAIKFQILSQYGLTSLFFGIGIMIGIALTLMWINKKNKRC
tara:strand:- start:1235 stop:1660 length:426 start_codon:yes stop_codon:yes gene_type:complete